MANQREKERRFMKVWDSTIYKVTNIERYISKLYQVTRKKVLKSQYTR